MVQSTIAAGAVIAGRYEIAAPIGRGGMGVVYDAHDMLHDRARCAIKIMTPTLVEDADRKSRFDREARIGVSLRSSHVTTVLDHGIDAESGLPYLVMERLQGQGLDAHMAHHGRVSRFDARRILTQLCDAVGAAHAAGVIHRDLKPSNIYVLDSGDIKILDFGIAKVISDLRATSSIIIGTPGWMAPEQLDQSIQIGPPIDVWALGLLAFYVLTGKEYWLSSRVKTDAWAALSTEICASQFEKASARAERLGVTNLPPAFDEWFARCVVRDPAARHPDGGEAGRALAGVFKVSLIKTPVPPQVISKPVGEPVPLPPSPDQEDEQSLALAHAATVLSGRIREALRSNKPPVVAPPVSAPDAGRPDADSTPPDSDPPKKKKKKKKATSSVTNDPLPAAVPSSRGVRESRWIMMLIVLIALFLAGMALTRMARSHEEGESADPQGPTAIPLPSSTTESPAMTLHPEAPLVPRSPEHR